MFKFGYFLCFLMLIFSVDILGQSNYSDIVAQGLKIQIQVDSISRHIDAQKSLLTTVSELERRQIRASILNNDLKVVALQRNADALFAQAAALETTNVVSSGNIASRSSEFSIMAQSHYSSTNPIPVNVVLPDGILYRIRIGAFSNQVDNNTFRGLYPMSAEIAENGMVRYFVGLFWKYSEAQSALQRVHQYGYNQAYIVATHNRVVISIERARQLE
jgi:hypothetical protein